MAKKTRRPRVPVPPPRELTIADAVSEAFGEFTSLGEEMRDWADSLEERFSQTDKYQRVSDAAETLENISEPNYPDELKDVRVTIQDPKTKYRGYSRSDRCSQACTILDICIEELDKIIEGDKQPQEKRDAAETLRDDCDNAKSDAEGVEFPGMYG